MTPAAETDIAWDLGDLFAGPDDPRLDETLRASATRASAFASTYEGKLDTPDLTAQTLGAALTEYEALWQAAAAPGMYARLRFSADTGDAARGALLSRVQEEMTRLSLPLTFFRLELAHIPEAVLTPLLADPAVAPFAHYLAVVRAGQPH